MRYILVALVLSAACRHLTADCEREPACGAEGLCTKSFVRGGDHGYRCYAANDADCKRSRACRDDGRCSANGDGTCVRRDQAVDPRTFCRRDPDCAMQGWCSPLEGTCEAGDDAECAASIGCKTIGRCRARNGICYATSDDCTSTLECRAFGRCALVHGDCVKPGEPARPAAYCLGPSSGCYEFGRCLRAPDDRCVTLEEAQLPGSLAVAPPDALKVAAPAPAPPPDAGPQPHDVEVAIRCGDQTFYGLAPSTWQPAEAHGCAARWRAGDAWVVARCLPPTRIGLPELDAWYRLFRRADGSELPDVGQGHASLSSSCDHRVISIAARGTLVAAIDCVPLTPPAKDVVLERDAMEADRALVVLDLVGSRTAVDAAEGDVGALTYSLRTRAGVGGEPYSRERGCP